MRIVPIKWTLLILFCPFLLTAQVPGNSGVIRIFSKPNDIKIKIKGLDYKYFKSDPDAVIIPGVSEGTYQFRFSTRGYKLRAEFFIPANDTVSILADFNQMGVTSATTDELRDLLIENRKRQSILDSLLKSGYVMQKRNNGPDTLPGKPEISNDTILHHDLSPGGDVYYIVEEMPSFNGGDPAIEFRKYIAYNLLYPDSAAIKGISGTVIVQFEVDPEGLVRNVKILKGADPFLDQEAVRVVRSSPRWTPGRQRGKPVSVLFTFPIHFVLN